MTRLVLYAYTLLIFSTLIIAQLRKEARWCAINYKEWEKCRELAWAMNIVSREIVQGGQEDPYAKLPEHKCVLGTSPFDCMQRISNNEADLITLDPGMGYTAGEYYTMMPIMAERYKTGPGEDGIDSLAVAVVRKNNPDINFNNLAGKKACHTGVGRAAGWVYPISTLIKQEKMPITECNVPVKSAGNFFGTMCAPNALARYYNPFGNNPASVCENCKGDYQTYCSSNDPYAGYDGAFTCMTRDGDVAFVRDHTIVQMTKNSTQYTPQDFELVCTDGTRRASDQAATCNWGKVSSHVVMTSAIRDYITRDEYKQLLTLISQHFGEQGTYKHIFEVFSSSKYSVHNLMFTDHTKELKDVGSRDSYYTWAGEEFRERLQQLNACPITQVRWCVISRHEMMKCENMIMAFAAKGLKPDLNCILGTNTRDCMDKIRNGDADLITVDAADLYVAGRLYNLVPIASEDYSGYDNSIYYAVAVARKNDAHLTIFNLKNRRSCHSAVNTAAGWIIPVDKLIDTEQIRVRDCNVYHSVGQFFSKSCVPGVLHDQYNPHNSNPTNLCEACASTGYSRCKRNDAELYYGNTGAFRCLTERGGDVAFVRHTTARENTDGGNQAEWSRNRRSDDYELLCPDGRRAQIDAWSDCHMGEIPANAIVTAHFKDKSVRDIYWTLLNYAQQFFASDSNEDFNMFASSVDPNRVDLLFQDSTVRLVPVDESKQNYRDYLGPTFMRAMERMSSIDCISAKAVGHASTVGLWTLLAIVLTVFRLLRC